MGACRRPCLTILWKFQSIDAVRVPLALMPYGVLSSFTCVDKIASTTGSSRESAAYRHLPSQE